MGPPIAHSHRGVKLPRKARRDELEELWTARNRGGHELTVVAAEYLEVVAIRA